MIQAAYGQFWKSFNTFFADFGHVYPDIQCKLFNQFCCSFYGSQLWNFNDYSIICTAWRKALRKIWNVPHMTHCKIVALLSNSKPLELSLRQRFCKFAKQIFMKGSQVVQSIANIACNNPLSVFGANCSELRCKYDTNFNVCHRMIEYEWFNSVDEETISNVLVLKEMIQVRNGINECESLNLDDVLYIIEDICVY